jgi:hypothetical protein
MDLIEGAALLGFFAMLAFIVIEIAWREPSAAREILCDAEAFARKGSPPPEPAVRDEKVLHFAAEPSAAQMPASTPSPAAPVPHEEALPRLERAS